MGLCYSCCKYMLCPPKVDVLHVGDDPKDPNYGIGFAKALFQKNEFFLLKKFTSQKRIHQTDLNLLYSLFLTGEDVFLRNFRVRTTDTKVKFQREAETLLSFEIADVYLPALFMKPFPEAPKILPQPAAYDEVTFTRFVIIGFIFCAQPVSDLIYDFFSIFKQNFTMKLSTTFFTFNIKHLMAVNTEEMKRSAALRYILDKISPKDDTELRLETIIMLGLKYPIIFYPLERFRHKFKRVMFGDKFWSNKKTTKSKFQDVFGKFKGRSPGYETEGSAVRHTARSIVSDCCEIAQTLERRRIALREGSVEMDEIEALHEQHLAELRERIGMSSGPSTPVGAARANPELSNTIQKEDKVLPSSVKALQDESKSRAVGSPSILKRKGATAFDRMNASMTDSPGKNVRFKSFSGDLPNPLEPLETNEEWGISDEWAVEEGNRSENRALLKVPNSSSSIKTSVYKAQDNETRFFDLRSGLQCLSNERPTDDYAGRGMGAKTREKPEGKYTERPSQLEAIPPIELNTHFFPQPDEIDSLTLNVMKNILGYRMARELVLESELPVQDRREQRTKLYTDMVSIRSAPSSRASSRPTSRPSSRQVSSAQSEASSECGDRLQDEQISQSGDEYSDDSEYEDPQPFLEAPRSPVQIERIYDKKIEREFVYDVNLGTRAWVSSFWTSEGDHVRDIHHKTWHK